MAAKKKKARKGRKGARKGARRASTAKRGAAKRQTLRAGVLVTKKPSKKTLRAHKMHAKKVGTLNGKTTYKLVKNKKPKATARSGYANAMRARAHHLKAEKEQAKKAEAALKKQWREVIKLREKAEKLGLAAEMDANAQKARELQKQIDAKAAEKARLDAELENARAEAARDRQSYED